MRNFCALWLVLFPLSVFPADRDHVRTSSGGSGSVTTFSCEPSVTAWAEKLTGIAEKSSRKNPKGGRYTTPGGLVDTRNFISSDTLAYLGSLSGREDGKDKLLTTEESANVIINGKIWKLTESPWYRDQYPSGKAMSQRHLVLRQEPSAMERNGRSKVFEFPLKDILNGNRVRFDKLREFAQNAEENARKEITDPAKIAGYDLPRGVPIGYIGLIPRGSDVIVNGIREDVKKFPAYLNCLERGYQFVGFGPRSVVEVAKSPKEIIRAMVKEYKENGVNTIYLNAAAHGNESGIHFPTSDGDSVILKPSDLTEIFDEFSDTQFVIDTVACHAGGLPEAMEKYKDKSGKTGRIMSFLQTKGTSLNQEGRILGSGSPPTIVSSYYNVFRVGALKRNPTLGAAHLEADVLAKTFIPSDAEAYSSGPNGGTGTKGLKQ